MFGPSHAEEIATSLKVPLLAQLPLAPAIAIRCDLEEVEDCRVDNCKTVAYWLQAITLKARPPKMPVKYQQPDYTNV